MEYFQLLVDNVYFFIDYNKIAKFPLFGSCPFKYENTKPCDHKYVWQQAIRLLITSYK